MIRREAGDEFLLIAQNDHALLAAELARHFGNDAFIRPSPWQDVIDGIALHDAGWPLHDDEPTLNGAGLPLDVFESPRTIAFKVWQASADRARSAGPYANLLVSLHNLSLSVIATTPTGGAHEKFDMTKMTEQFELNKFQHREIERQENLRRELGMRTDQPLKFGLALSGGDEREEKLIFHFRLLQAMDLCSLALCCTAPPAGKSNDVLPRPEAAPVHLRFRREGDDLRISPWPFGPGSIGLQVPFRRVRGTPFRNEDEFREVFDAAPREGMEVRVLAEG